MLVAIRDSRTGKVKKVEKRIAGILVRLKKAEFVTDFHTPTGEGNKEKMLSPEITKNPEIEKDKEPAPAPELEEEEYDDEEEEEISSSGDAQANSNMETPAKKKRGRPRKQTYETKVMTAEV